MSASLSFSSFRNVRCFLENLPQKDDDVLKKAAQKEMQLTKPQGSLGKLEALSAWTASWQGHYPPTFCSPVVCVFAGNHGICTHAVSAYPSSVTEQMVKNFLQGGAAINQLCRLVKARLNVVPLHLEKPTKDFSKGKAMSEKECLDAMKTGHDSIPDETDILGLGEMGIGNTTAAAAICLSLFGGTATKWVGRGTGINDQTLKKKSTLVAKSVQRHRQHGQDGLDILCCVGGYELAALVGAILSARARRIPVLLDGYTTTAAASVLHHITPEALDHCHVAHLSAEKPHKRLLHRINKAPLLTLDMRLGEASGAALALHMVKAAVFCHNRMRTFDEANVDQKTP